MSNNIEELNRQIIKSRVVNTSSAQSWSPKIVINESVKDAVVKHRAFFGITHKIAIMRSLVKTRPFVTTVYPPGYKCE
jgi:hypothetical protein